MFNSRKFSVRITSPRFRAITRVILFAALLATLGMLAPNVAPYASAHFQTLPAERVLNPDGTLNTNAGFSGTLDLRGWNVTLDSQRGPILTPQSKVQDVRSRSSNSGGLQPLGVPPNAPQAGSSWSPLSTWSALPNKGLNGSVSALAINGTDLYVGGTFTGTSDGALTLNHIARFSTTTKTWSPLPNNGLNGSSVLALALTAEIKRGTDLWVGGNFTGSADGALTLNNIAVYNTWDNTWSPLPNKGLDFAVQALAVNGGDLYVGGWFYQTADCNDDPQITCVKNLNGIAKFSGGAWVPFPNKGLGGVPYSLAFIGSDLYVGGWFSQTADCSDSPQITCVKNLNGIAKFSGGAWSSLSHNGLNSAVSALAFIGSDLYVGGGFTKTADGVLTLSSIAKYNTTNNTWSPLANNSLSSTISAFAVSGNNLYVGGDIAGGDFTLNGIAKYSTTNDTWSPFANYGVYPQYVYALAFSGSDLYVGGYFSKTASCAAVPAFPPYACVENLNNIANVSVLCKIGVDSAGDGLPDIWKTNGVWVDSGVVVTAGRTKLQFIDLPAMGADPNKPTIFVQIDTMISLGISPDALKIVVNAFANAPYISPTKSKGIDLIIDNGGDSTVNYTTGKFWGSLSKAQVLQYSDNLGTSDAHGNYDWTAYDAIKNVTGGIGDGFTTSGRAPVFHYVIYANKYGGTGPPYSSGISRGIGASDLIVSLQGSTDVNEQAGTLMHELGHNLFLHHGGGDDINYKPNYLSIMNYAFQFRGLIKGHSEGNFDYSQTVLPNLNKSNLLELNGLGPSAAGYGTRHYCASTDTYLPLVNANGAIDWDCDGSSTGPATAYDINNDGNLNETLTGYNDWANLKLKGGAIGLCSAPALPIQSSPEPVVSIRIVGLGQNLFLPLIIR